MPDLRSPFEPPFASDFNYLELQKSKDAATTTVPGHPRVQMNDREAVTEFLLEEYCSSDMDTMSKFLWMMSMQSHRNISPLHRQKLKGREIVITEDPKLHLVWFYDRIFLKPLPQYLCSYMFWAEQLDKKACTRDRRRLDARVGALGYLRTWFFLIRHESDFRIATSPELMLLPEGMTWDGFCKMSASFGKIENSEVSARYSFGEIRLTRLNLYAKLFLSKWSYQRMQGQYGQYFARFYGPLLFLIAIVSILLNSLQVVMAVEQVNSYEWTTFGALARWFAVICCVFTVVIAVGLAGLLVIKIAKEWTYALGDRFKRDSPPKKDLEIQQLELIRIER